MSMSMAAPAGEGGPSVSWPGRGQAGRRRAPGGGRRSAGFRARVFAAGRRGEGRDTPTRPGGGERVWVASYWVNGGEAFA